MKKISLEIQAACGVKTGIGWYIYNLVKNLKESNNNEYTGEIFNFMSRKDLEDFSKINLNMKQNKIIPYSIYDKIKRKLPIKYNRLIGTKSDIYHLIDDLTATGLSIIFISSEMPELINMCDRIVVMNQGHTTGILNRNEFNQEKIMAFATKEIG